MEPTPLGRLALVGGEPARRCYPVAARARLSAHVRPIQDGPSVISSMPEPLTLYSTNTADVVLALRSATARE
jgi:hypothetical protein